MSQCETWWVRKKQDDEVKSKQDESLWKKYRCMKGKHNRFIRDIERNKSLSDLVFSDREMKKGHDRTTVESKGYHKIVCCFYFWWHFHMMHRVSGWIPGWNREHWTKPGVKQIHSGYHKEKYCALLRERELIAWLFSLIFIVSFYIFFSLKVIQLLIIQSGSVHNWYSDMHVWIVKQQPKGCIS